MGYVYILTSNYLVFKIGVTSGKIEKRIRALQTGNAEKIDLVKSYKTDNYRNIETWLHHKFNEKRLEGEWFQLNETDINQFESLCEARDKNITLLKEENHFFKKRDKS